MLISARTAKSFFIKAVKKIILLLFYKGHIMRVRNIEYFLNKLGASNFKKGPKNNEEIINQKLAEYYFYFAQKKETKKVA
jgi:hypothetical protein